MLMRDPYSVLGVKRDADQEDIRTAWRSLAKALHPDQNQDDPFATMRFTEIGRAYELLRDPQRRGNFDRAHREAEIRREMNLRRMEQMRQQQSARKPEPAEQKPADDAADEMISRIFGAEARPVAGDAGAKPARTAVSDPKPEAKDPPRAGSALEGDSTKAEAAARARAPAAELISSIIKRIRGLRTMPEKAPDLVADLVVTVDELLSKAWKTVEAQGQTVRLQLQPGMTEGHVVQLREQGHRIQNLKRGDAIVTIRIAPGDFRVEGFDLRTPLPITIENAVLGCETTVRGPDGSVLPVVVPEWSGSDHVLRIEGHGLHDASGGRGDLLAEIRLMLWEKPDQKVIDLMRHQREGLYL
ncbi:DnaJ domain-containing protein [Rhizobium sp. TRM95111]|uniref:DnaJ domain-containing protein n=1 Tax=Rhizobium alarense TaxID=2846851 RepID=UPI001F28D91C|nr:DnaJ domain-containing protein [Rhizobium alarense]MCF3640167.1 DnaJ domain-containing protein [Rhizobium alarense]